MVRATGMDSRIFEDMTIHSIFGNRSRGMNMNYGPSNDGNG